MIRLETCVLHRRRDKERKRLREKISRLLGWKNSNEICECCLQEFPVYEANMAKIRLALAKKRVDFFISLLCFFFFFSFYINKNIVEETFSFPINSKALFHTESLDYSLNNLIPRNFSFAIDKHSINGFQYRMKLFWKWNIMLTFDTVWERRKRKKAACTEK